MRLITRKIYRAFEELDPYTDDQCARFVKAANRGWIRRGVHLVLVLGIGTLIGVTSVMFGSVVLLAGRVERLVQGPGLMKVVGIALMLAMLVLICIPGPVAGFIVRDRLLRRRLRRALRVKGVCTGCGYGLVGLPVGIGNRVTCPECGIHTEVDPALGELVLDEAGRGKYQPHIADLTKPTWLQRKLTPARKRKLKRAGVISAAGFVVVLVAGVAGYELFLRWQAGVAAKERPTAEQFIALVEARQPPGGKMDEGGANAFDLLSGAMRIHDGIVAQIKQNQPPQDSQGREVPLDVAVLLGKRREVQNEDPELKKINDEMDRLQRELAMRVLDDGERQGLFEAIGRMVAAPRAVFSAGLSSSTPVMLQLTASRWSELRALSAATAARARLAMEAGNREQFLESLDMGLGLARMQRRQVGVYDWQVAMAMEQQAMQRAIEALLSHPDAAMLDGMEQVLRAQDVWRDGGPGEIGNGAETAWESERLMLLDAACWFFSEPSQVRFGSQSAAVQRMLGWGGSDRVWGWLGTYAGNREDINGLYANWTAAAKADPAVRGPLLSPESSNKMLIRNLISDPTRLLEHADRRELVRRAVPVLIALERHRLRTGEYPASLSELDPQVQAKLPKDPWTGRAFGYAKLAIPERWGEPVVKVGWGQGVFERGYLVYSLGWDQTDNGGMDPQKKVQPDQALAITRRPEVIGPGPVLVNGVLVRRPCEGLDYIVNQRPRE